MTSISLSPFVPRVDGSGCILTRTTFCVCGCTCHRDLDFLKSPSFLISGSGGRPAREGQLPLPRARYFGVSRFRNRASKKKTTLWGRLVGKSKRDRAQTCRKIIWKRKQLFLLLLTVKFYYGIYLPIGWSLALTHPDNLGVCFLVVSRLFAWRIAKQSVPICIIIVHISKFPKLKKLFLDRASTFNQINFVCFAFEQYERMLLK